MRLSALLVLALCVSNYAAAQTQEVPANQIADNSTLEKELRALQAALAQQQEQIRRQQKEIENLQGQLAAGLTRAGDIEPGSAQVVDAVLHVPVNEVAAGTVAVPGGPLEQGSAAPEKESPLSFSIGNVQFTPAGTIDFTSVFRTTDIGSGVGTTFGSVPFNNTGAGQLSEDRLTAQNSKVILKLKSKFGENDIKGYFETDFLGNDASNVFVTNNAHTYRLRLYWMDLRHGKWEVMGGQTWSWLTPNRVGLAPDTSDLFNGMGVDSNSMAGLTWTRAAELRVAYHPNEQWAFGVAIENPEQYTGTGEVVFPAAYNTALGTQLNAGTITTTPNLHPDVIPKVTYDTEIGEHHFHAEAVGLVTSVKVVPNPATGVSSTATGGGGSVNLNLEVVKKVRLIANTFYSDGGGRYIGGLGPGAVVRPNGDVSLVHAGSGIGGVEVATLPNDTFGAYYSAGYFQRNFFADTTSTAATKPIIGFGGPGSSSSANRAIQEATFDWIHTFWKNPKYGALQTLTQYSYLTRSPWFVAANTPKNAHTSMVYADFRYVVP